MRSQSKHLSLIYEKPLSNKVTKQQHSLVNEIVDVNKAISQHVCNLCKSASIIFDEPTGETVCSQCGTVTSDKALYGACLKDKKGNISQARIAKAGGISVVTLRKRVADISNIFPGIQI
jgi:ribosomal protein L37AE/L43A